jgi:phage replication O-like protein O
VSGYEPPNHTQTPNAFFDVVMPQIETMSELKVTLAIIRQTHGWHKNEDVLSLSQLQKLTGMRRESVVDGVERALGRGSIVRRKVGQSYSYGLKVVRKPDQLAESASPQTGPQVVRKPDPQKKGKESNTAKADETSSPTSAFPLMKEYADLLDEAMPLSGKERGKLASALQKQLEKGANAKRLRAALCHMVARRHQGQRLELEDALNDVGGAGRPPSKVDKSGSPACVVEAIQGHEHLKDYLFLVQEWDFTRDEKVPDSVFRRIGGTDDERHANLQRMKSVSRRAVKEAG